MQCATTQLAKMSIDPKFVELTAGVLKKKNRIPTPTIIVEKNKMCSPCIYIYIFFFNKIVGPLPLRKTHPHSILQVPTTQLANMSIDPKFVELTADVFEIFS